MVLAYIFVRTEAGAETSVREKVRKWKQVKETHILYGEWDLIVKISVPSIEDITAFVVDKLRHIPEVKITSTMIVAE